MKASYTSAIVSTAFFAAVIFNPTTAFAATAGACSLLSAADVAAALSTRTNPGQPITPADRKVCTWKASDGQSWVTLFLQPSSAFDGGLRLAGYSNGTLKPIQVAGLGEGAYFLPIGDQVGLMVKKGDVAFKVAVYHHGPLGPKEAAERALAVKVVGRL